MAKHIGPDRPGEERNPDFRVRTGRASRHESSVSARLARALGGRGRAGGSRQTSGKRHGGSKGRGTMPFGATNPRSQRVVVKVVSRYHRAGKTGGLSKHVSYLGRDSASRDGKPGLFYSAEQDAVDARQTTKQWEKDPHHFRVIISPQKASDIADLRSYVRDVMQRVEQDLGVKTEWVAVDHHNTDNPHTHVLIRGADERGQQLFIRREYIAHGFRERASEAATELLGERSEKELQQARVKEVTAERFTSLDRTIERGMEDGRFDASPAKRIGLRKSDRALVLARLQHLQRMGLAEPESGTKWRIDPQFKTTLMRMGVRNDIIKQLYSSLGSRSANVEHGPINEPVAGVVVAKGAVDEIEEQRFVVVQDHTGQMRYARVRDGEVFRSLRVGDEAELGGATYQRRQIARQVLEATGRGNLYIPAEHEAKLRSGQHNPDALTLWMYSVRRQVEMWADRPGSGIERGQQHDTYRVDGKRFEQFTQRRTSRGITDVRNLTAIRAASRKRDRGAETER